MPILQNSWTAFLTHAFNASGSATLTEVPNARGAGSNTSTSAGEKLLNSSSATVRAQ